MSSIPKIIHYCWFGGNPLPELAIKCIDSWKKIMPDYEIVEWNENNFDINIYKYTKEAYNAKKYAFVSDVVRLYALVTIGGIYMDTDVEVLKPLDEFLYHDAFSGFEDEKLIPTGIMASQKGFPLFEEFLKDYETTRFLKDNGKYDMTTNVEKITNKCREYGFIGNNKFQVIRGFTLYPKTYFCPLNHYNSKTYFTNNTYTIHHFNASWLSEKERKRRKSKLYQLKHDVFEKTISIIKSVLGEKNVNKIKKVIYK